MGGTRAVRRVPRPRVHPARRRRDKPGHRRALRAFERLAGQEDTVVGRSHEALRGPAPLRRDSCRRARPRAPGGPARVPAARVARTTRGRAAEGLRARRPLHERALRGPRGFRRSGQVVREDSAASYPALPSGGRRAVHVGGGSLEATAPPDGAPVPAERDPRLRADDARRGRTRCTPLPARIGDRRGAGR